MRCFRAIAFSVFIPLAGLCGAAAQAQQASAATEAPPLTEVIVTGSRIPVPANVSATSPLTQITRSEIQDQGHTDITDLINQLPQNFINSGSDLGNTTNPLSAAGGVATIDLRGLGPQRTLVLVDGKRLGNGDPNTLNPNPAADIDQIPAIMIEKIDVVTGGASATYGSDAMAGVVNFQLRHNFQGVEVQAQYGLNQHSNHDGFIQGQETASGINPPTGNTNNGYRRDLAFLIGTNTPDGNGNVTGYFSYHHQDPVAGSKYDFADCLYAGGACNNSPNSNQFNLGGNSYSVVGNQFLPYPQAGSSPPPTFNSSDFEYAQRDDSRYQGGFVSHYDINDYAKPYLDVSFMNDKTQAVVAPSGLFLTSNPYSADNTYSVNCGNPFLSAQQLGIVQASGQCAGGAADPGNFSIDIGRRNAEGGGRLSYFEHTNWRAVAGIKGKIYDGWDYDVYAQYYYTSLINTNNNYLSFTNINNALQVTGTAANPVCVSGGSCVPYNIFNSGGVTANQLSYLYTPGTASGNDSEKIWHADVTGDLERYGVKSPWASNGAAINLGYEHRIETLSFSPDAAESSGDLAGFSGAAPPISAAYSLNEMFAELRAPLLQDLPGVQDLTMDAGYRWSNYSTAGTTNTYKFEVQYAPIRDVRIRGSFDRAVRAPNLLELFNPQAYGQQSFLGVDPCVPTATGPATASLIQCERTGMTAAQYAAATAALQCPANQCGQVGGGNPNLRPETAVTWSIGSSYSPTFLPGFAASLDYYHIAISDEVGSIPGNFLFNNCLNTGDAASCSQVVRNPITGALHGATVAGGGYILQTNINAGAALVSGIDLQLAYRYATENFGTFVTNMTGTWVQHNIITPYPGAQSYDCAGLFGANCNNGINPTWRHTWRVTWETPWRVDLSALWRFIGPSSYDNNSTNPALAGGEEGAYSAGYARLSGYNYLDLTLGVHIWKDIEFRTGVQNLFDKDPPLLPAEITNQAQSNSFIAYDVLGRQLFASISAKF